MADSERVPVLCVDDEPNVLEGLSRQLRGRFAVTTAGGGAAGLEALRSRGPFAVAVSDLRMPGMDGVAFLKCVREVAPDTVRVLLTGQADLASTAAAVNEGNIFRFLLKPCPAELLVRSLQDAVEQHRLITSERVLLRDTLVGSIKMLMEILSLASPAAFGRAIRARQYVAELSAGLGSRDSWHLDVAAMLSQVGCVTLPPPTIEKLHAGEPLGPAEEAQVERLPEVAEQLLANIPRLDSVREILRYLRKNYDGSGIPAGAVQGEAIPWGARVLRVVLDFDRLRSQGLPEAQAFGRLEERRGVYDPALLAEFIRARGSSARRTEETVLSLREIQEGMVFAEDVKTRTGLLLVARGHEATVRILERIRSLSAANGVKEPIRVLVRRSAPVVEVTG